MTRRPVTQDYLKRLLEYDPATGIFRWLEKRGRVRIGTVAGYVIRSRAGIGIRIDGVTYRAARLAFLYVTGEWPTGDVIALDYNPFNLAWSNLRDATRSEVRAHCRFVSNRIGFRGVYRNSKGAIYAQIRVNRKAIHLGYFDTIEAASAAYQKAARDHFGEFARAV